MSTVEPLFDPQALLARVRGDVEFLRELVGLFVEETTEQVQAMRAALRSGDAKQLALAAHAVGGVIGHFGTGRAFQSARRLEQLARAGDLGSAAGVHADLEPALAALQTALAAFVGIVPPENRPARNREEHHEVQPGQAQAP